MHLRPSSPLRGGLRTAWTCSILLVALRSPAAEVDPTAAADSTYALVDSGNLTFNVADNGSNIDIHNLRVTAGNLAFPFSPSDFPVGEAFEFSVYHLMPLGAARLFPVEVVDV